MAAFTVIDHTELSGNAASYDVTSIPSSYDHLLLKVSARTDKAAAYLDEHWLTINGDTASNYSTTTMQAGSATVGSNRNSGATKIENLPVAAASVGADNFSIMELWIPNYAGTTGYKQVLAKTAVENDSTTDWRWALNMTAGLWDSTAAINQITLTPKGGDDYIQYSTFTLYGLTGA